MTDPHVLRSAVVLIGCVGWAACATPDAGPSDADEGEIAPVVETRWTSRTELFVEYPPLVEQQTSRFAIHFTDLATFQPVRAGRATVRLTGQTTTEFVADAPGRPGIFGVDVTPAAAGTYRLALSLDAPGLRDVHELGEVVVLAAAQTARPQDAASPDDGIAFLKEQQWALDFATASVERRAMSDSLVIAADVEPRTGGQVEVTTPVDGRVAGDLSLRPVGSPVERGATLAEIIPHSQHGEDRPALELDVAVARDALELARAERARVDRLVDAGALAERRKLEAVIAEQTASARLRAAEAHLAQLEATRVGQNEGPRDIRFVLRAPISGIIARSTATPGASVEAGARLFEVVALDRVHIVGALPEAVLPRLDAPVGAELEVPGRPPVALDRLVGVGRVLDRDSRTVPIAYELSDPAHGLAIGQAVSLRIFLSNPTEAPTVPESAVVDDAGQPVVFVQVGGETFERRVVEPGNRQAGLVQVRGDLTAGERVVVRGGPFIRLAALSPQLPAHGHTH